MDKLPRCGANYAPLSPLTFLRRAASVYADRTSVVYRSRRFTWRQTYDRCLRLASSLRSLNISRNDVVSVLAPNVPAMYEMHFAVPMAGAVLNTINTRLDGAGIATILRHSEAKLFFVDYEYVRLAVEALRLLAGDGSPLPLVVVVDDAAAPTGARLGELEYEGLIAAGDPEGPRGYRLEDEWDAIALNYTSGTTSVPKGVVYSHRGAFLSTMSLLLQWGVGPFPVYLWSLPMFHCNGWTFTWGVAARGGTNVCIRTASDAEIFEAIYNHGVTHMCCAPVVFNILLGEGRRALPHAVHVLIGGAPPPAALLSRVENMGFRVTHAYGLTEATGPAMVCEWQPEWDSLGDKERAAVKARQGVGVLTLADTDVRDISTNQSVPRDGRTTGEIVLRGSSIMKGYLKNEKGTREAFLGAGADAWFRTGDVGVVHPDGYVEIRDRSKDVIISGGENISSVEVEAALYAHPKVLEAAVVAMPHAHWGESPCAFVALRKGAEAEEEEMIEHCRRHMARFMVPKKVVFVPELPKTSTGKIPKFKLREVAKGFTVDETKKKKKDGSTSLGNSKKNNIYNDHKEEQQHAVVAMSRL